MSIALPNSEVLFREQMFSEEFAGKYRFNLVSFLGMFITKMDSCQKPKRERDSFDIYLGFVNKQISIHQLNDIVKRNKRIGESLSNFRKHIETKRAEFDKCVAEYCKPTQPSPADFILSELTSVPTFSPDHL